MLLDILAKEGDGGEIEFGYDFFDALFGTEQVAFYVLKHITIDHSESCFATTVFTHTAEVFGSNVQLVGIPCHGTGLWIGLQDELHELLEKVLARSE